VDGLAVDGFPVGSAFVVGKGVEEGFPEGGFRSERRVLERIGFRVCGRCGCGGVRASATVASTVVPVMMVPVMTIICVLVAARVPVPGAGSCPGPAPAMVVAAAAVIQVAFLLALKS
jgi:hypothetical protein